MWSCGCRGTDSVPRMCLACLRVDGVEGFSKLQLVGLMLIGAVRSGGHCSCCLMQHLIGSRRPSKWCRAVCTQLQVDCSSGQLCASRGSIYQYVAAPPAALTAAAAAAAGSLLLLLVHVCCRCTVSIEWVVCCMQSVTYGIRLWIWLAPGQHCPPLQHRCNYSQAHMHALSVVLLCMHPCRVAVYAPLSCCCVCTLVSQCVPLLYLALACSCLAHVVHGYACSWVSTCAIVVAEPH